jgi:hypothetical protein
MLALIRWGSGLLALLLATPFVTAQVWVSPVYCRPYQPAPDACGPGFYSVGPGGMVYGPNYYLVPPWAPVGGCSPAAASNGRPSPMPAFNPQSGKVEFPDPGPQAKQQYPTHPFVRSPRDFFMWNEALEEQERRSARPAFVP